MQIQCRQMYLKSLFLPPRIDYLHKAKLFDYRKKFEADYVLAGFTNNILVNVTSHLADTISRGLFVLVIQTP